MDSAFGGRSDLNNIYVAFAFGVSREGVLDILALAVCDTVNEAEGASMASCAGLDSSPHSLPYTNSGDETPPMDQDRASIPLPTPSSFGGDGDTTPQEGGRVPEDRVGIEAGAQGRDWVGGRVDLRQDEFASEPFGAHVEGGLLVPMPEVAAALDLTLEQPAQSEASSMGDAI